MTIKNQGETRNVNDAITECVLTLLNSFNERIVDEEIGSNKYPKAIGEIHVIVDENNEIDVVRISQRHKNKGHRTAFILTETIAAADITERMLIVWATDIDSLKDIVTAAQPEYAEPERQGDLKTIVQMISDAMLNAIITDPSSPRYTLLKNAFRYPTRTHYGNTMSMAHEIVDVEPEEPEVDNLITKYISYLLDRYDEQLEDPNDNPAKLLGAIRIIIDDGTVGARLNKRFSENAVILLCLPTLYDANEVEYILTQWAADYEILEEVIKVFRPGHPDPEFYDDYISQAVDEIAEVFFQTVVIPPDSVMYARLCEAVR